VQLIIHPDDKGMYSLLDADRAYIEIKKWNDFALVLSDIRNGTLKRNGERWQPRTVNIDAFSSIPALQREAQTGSDPPWLKTIEDSRNAVSDFKKLDINLNMVCWELLEKDEITGALVGGALLPGKVLPREIPAICDMVIHMRSEQVNNRTVTTLYFVKHGFWDAKDRFGKLPPTLTFTAPEEPTWQVVEEYLNGTRKREVAQVASPAQKQK
jgi:hypothetical protein